MIDRVNRYYQLPASMAMVKHMREEIGLTGSYLEIFDDLRRTFTSTAGHAQNVGMSLKEYNAQAAIVGKALIYELLDLAEEALRSRNANRPNDGRMTNE